MPSVRIRMLPTNVAENRLKRIREGLAGKPMAEAVRSAGLQIERSARRYAPVNTGRLRASITTRVASIGRAVVGSVGSNLDYAPYMELGTKPHFPPVAALETWARRHGTSAYAVALAISRRGLKPRRFLGRAFIEHELRVVRYLDRQIAKIIGGA